MFDKKHQNEQRAAAGKQAEAAACDYLQARGLTLMERNYRCKRGEIDLIMRDKQHTVFVEVRYRRSNRFGSSAESVDWRKQAKLLTTAEHYLQQHPQAAKGACRFDVVALSTQNGEQTIDWISDAFQA
jgi:putative endonuclease